MRPHIYRHHKRWQVRFSIKLGTIADFLLYMRAKDFAAYLNGDHV